MRGARLSLLLAVATTFAGAGAGCSSRADLDAGRYYACDRAAGGVEQQCPGNWICTLDGFCQDPAVGAALSCSSSTDCTGGWHCGVEGVCYQRETARDVDCRVDVPEDCAPGWQCGLEGVCHDSSLAAPYRCDGSDQWCTGGWRCGTQDICVDARAEGLRPATSALTVERISPRHPVTADEAVASGTYYSSDGSKDLVALRNGSSLWLGMIAYGQEQLRLSTQLQAPAFRGMTAAGETFFWLEGTSTLKAIDTAGMTFATPRTIGLGSLSSIDFIRSNTDDRTLLAAVSRDRIAYLTQGASTLGTPVSLGAGFELFDLADATYHSSSWDVADYNAYLSLAATDGGVFIAYEDELGNARPPPSVWRPVSLPGIPNAKCGTAPVNKPVRIRGAGDISDYASWVAVEVRTPAGGTLLGNYERIEKTFPTTNCPSADLSAKIPLMDPCGGRQLRDFRPTYRGELLVRCETPDAGAPETTRLVYVQADGGIVNEVVSQTYVEEPTDLPLAPSVANSFSPALDGTGRLGSCDVNDGLYNCFWFGQDRVPAHVVKLSDGGVSPIQFNYREADPEQYVAATNHLTDFGLTREFYAFGEAVAGDTEEIPNPCGVVRGAPDLVTFCQPGEDVSLFRYDDVHNYENYPDPSLRTKAILTNSAGAFPGTDAFPRTQASAAELPDGGQVIAMSAFDSLWVGPVDSSPDAGLSRLTARIVPQVRGEITSLTVSDRTPDGLFLEGYVIAQERVYHLTAGSEVRWTATPVGLPDGRPVKVWTDGRWGRVGFEDGRVFSLPSAVQIGAALPTATVVDFGEVCGHSYALTSRALLQLDVDPGGSSVGVWAPVSLDAAGLPPLALTFEDHYARFRQEYFRTHPPKPDYLVDDGNSLLLFTTYGATIRVTDPSCTK